MVSHASGPAGEEYGYDIDPQTMYRLSQRGSREGDGFDDPVRELQEGERRKYEGVLRFARGVGTASERAALGLGVVGAVGFDVATDAALLLAGGAYRLVRLPSDVVRKMRGSNPSSN